MDNEDKTVVEEHEIPLKKQKIARNDSTNNIATTQTSNESNLTEKKKVNQAEFHDSFNSEKNAIKFSTELKTKRESENPEPPPTPEEASGMSPQSEASESDWQPPTHGALDWIYSQMLDNQDPRDLLYKLLPNGSSLSRDLSSWDLWRLLIRLLTEPPRRTKLPHVNTLDDVINLISTSQKIMVLTGAGVSVSCGIPDFRSRNGVYARLAVDFPDLPNPEAMFDISYFKKDHRPFFKFAKEIYPGQFKPSPVHRFISLLEREGKLLRNYTQNIDTLEQVAGISRVIQCHGSFATASCQVCRHQVDGSAIRDDVFNQVVPLCPRCSPSSGRGILKPDIVFFGESLPQHFHRQLTSDKDEVDLLVVIGSALKVRPVALIPNSLPEGIPQILINREPLTHIDFDVELLGDADGVVAEISRRLGDKYSEIYRGTERLKEVTELPEDGKSSDTSAAAGSSDPRGSHSAAANSSSDGDAKTFDLPTSNHMTSEQKDGSKTSMDVENLKGLWRSRWKQPVSKKLPAGTYFYDGKHRYVFPGAEIPPEEESDCSSDESSEEANSSDDDINPVSRGRPSFLHPSSCGQTSHETKNPSDELLNGPEAPATVRDEEHTDADQSL